MLFRKKLMAFACCLLWLSGVQAQKLDSILNVHFEAWGQEQLEHIRTYQMNIFEVGGILDQKKYSLTVKRPNKLKIEGLWQGQMYIQAYDGKEYWRIAPWIAADSAMAMTNTEILNFERSPRIDSPLYLAKKDSIDMTYFGEYDVDDRLYHVIRLVADENPVKDYFLDLWSGDIFKVVERDKGNEKYIFREIIFKSYKPQLGINIPMEYEIREKGKTRNVIINELVIGHGVPSSFFRKPE